MEFGWLSASRSSFRLGSRAGRASLFVGLMGSFPRGEVQDGFVEHHGDDGGEEDQAGYHDHGQGRELGHALAGWENRQEICHFLFRAHCREDPYGRWLKNLNTDHNIGQWLDDF